MDTGNSQPMNIDETENDTSHVCTLTKLTMILADDNHDEMTQLNILVNTTHSYLMYYTLPLSSQKPVFMYMYYCFHHGLRPESFAVVLRFDHLDPASVSLHNNVRNF